MSKKSSCPYYVGEPCSPSKKRNCFTLCEDCDGLGGINGKSFLEIKKEVAKYNRLGAAKAKDRGVKKTLDPRIGTLQPSYRKQPRRKS